jgi:hypothetical protein
MRTYLSEAVEMRKSTVRAARRAWRQESCRVMRQEDNKSWSTNNETRGQKSSLFRMHSTLIKIAQILRSGIAVKVRKLINAFLAQIFRDV